MRSATALSASPLDFASARGDGVLALQSPLPFPGVAPVLPVPVERGDSGPLRQRCARFMQALVEVLSGERPCRQMQTWLSPAVYDRLTRRLVSGSGPLPRSKERPKARLVSVHVSMLDSDIAEIAARMVHRGRSRAIAVRLEPFTTHRGDRMWRCTALEWA
ncbi:MAG TPA: Rv3235 family protein [Aeromicrobium sp.]|nr:Rv3235 family protein [Aeromicrobium sp.]